MLQVFLQPLGEVLRLLHRQLLQSIPDSRDRAHARTLGSPTRFANPNYPGRIWIACAVRTPDSTPFRLDPAGSGGYAPITDQDRKSTRLNSSHLGISYAV